MKGWLCWTPSWAAGEIHAVIGRSPMGTCAVTTPLGRYRQNYEPAFLALPAHPDEPTLHAAYELVRAAFADDVGLLDLIRTHRTVLAEVLLAGVDPPGLPAILDAAAGFLVESSAPFEMVRRSFLENTCNEKPRPDLLGRAGSGISGHEYDTLACHERSASCRPGRGLISSGCAQRSCATHSLS